MKVTYGGDSTPIKNGIPVYLSAISGSNYIKIIAFGLRDDLSAKTDIDKILIWGYWYG